MKKLMMIAGAVALAGMMSGCSTFDPLSVEQTARDREIYKEVNTLPVPSQKFKIAIRSSSLPHASDTSNDAYLASQMEGALAVNFSNLGWFETVDRKNGVSLAAEAMLSGDEAAVENVAGAQLALIAQSHVIYVAKQGWKRTAYASKARGAQVETDFRLIDIATKTPVIAKKFRSIVTDTGKGDVKSAITQVVNVNAKKFARIVASRLLPPVKVIQTRGDGRYAQIAMGKNYQATPVVKSWKWWPFKYLPLCYVKTEDVPATSVEFFTIEKEEVAGGNPKYEQSVFARGSVIQAENKKAWVEVENYEKANVFKGHNAKVSEATTGEDMTLE